MCDGPRPSLTISSKDSDAQERTIHCPTMTSKPPTARIQATKPIIQAKTINPESHHPKPNSKPSRTTANLTKTLTSPSTSILTLEKWIRRPVRRNSTIKVIRTKHTKKSTKNEAILRRASRRYCDRARYNRSGFAKASCRIGNDDALDRYLPQFRAASDRSLLLMAAPRQL